MAETSVAHSHGLASTNRSPSPISAKARRTPWLDATWDGRARIARRAAADTRKLPPSTRNAVPGCSTATTNPPIAGPIKRIISGRTMPWSAFAWGRRSAASRSGTMAVEAGLKKASPAPMNAISTTTCQSWMAPVIESRPRPITAAARTRSAPIISQRRSYRSVRTPLSSRKTTSGSVHATPTIESAVGTLLIW